MAWAAKVGLRWSAIVRIAGLQTVVRRYRFYGALPLQVPCRIPLAKGTPGTTPPRVKSTKVDKKDKHDLLHYSGLRGA
jgi:hypothetical protein